jgi:geranylgeranyl pyrophosphate synthase
MKKFSTVNNLKSTISKVDLPSSLIKYAELYKQTKHLADDLFPRKLNNVTEFKNYFKIDKLSHNVKVDGQTPVDSINAGLFIPCWELLGSGGKRWRPMFGLMVAKYFRIDEDLEKNKILPQLVAIPELIHNASLIIDDVEDKSETRRGILCTYKKYGEDIAINAGITMYYAPIFRMVENLNDSQKLLLYKIYLEEMVAIHLGQGWDIEMNGKNRIPLTSNYVDTVIFKTGCCPRLMVKLMQILVDHNKHKDIFKELIDIADFMSAAFQIKDDLLNITPSVLSKGKNYLGEDIYAGKQTIMVLHTLNSNNSESNKERLREILLMRTKSETLIKEAIDIMDKNGSIQYANDVMNKYSGLVEEKCKNLASQKSNLFDGQAANDIVHLMDYLINRDI